MQAMAAKRRRDEGSIGVPTRDDMKPIDIGEAIKVVSMGRRVLCAVALVTIARAGGSVRLAESNSPLGACFGAGGGAFAPASRWTGGSG